MAAMLLSRPTSKWTRLFGKTTSPRRAMAGRWCVCRSTLIVTFSDIVNLPQPGPVLAGAAFLLSGGRAQALFLWYYSGSRRRLQWGPLFLPAGHAREPFPSAVSFFLQGAPLPGAEAELFQRRQQRPQDHSGQR